MEKAPDPRFRGTIRKVMQLSEGPEQTGQDQDSEPTSAAGAASPQAEQADDKEQAEGDDTGQPGA